MKEEDGDASSHIFGQFRQSLHDHGSSSGLGGGLGSVAGWGWGGWGGASHDCVSGVQCDVRCQVICLPARVYFWRTGIAQWLERRTRD